MVSGNIYVRLILILERKTLVYVRSNKWKSPSGHGYGNSSVQVNEKCKNEKYFAAKVQVSKYINIPAI